MSARELNGRLAPYDADGIDIAGLVDNNGSRVESIEAMGTYRHLALTVIERAFRDVTSNACSLADRESAREFLVGSAIMRHWCRVAGLDPRRVIAYARRLR
jgi:hypothetical protein